MSERHIPGGTFLFDPDNQPFAEGRGRPVPEQLTDAWVWAPVGLSLTTAAVLAPLLLWRAGAPGLVLLLAGAGALGAGPMGLSALWLAGRAWRRARRYRQEGVLLIGRLLRVSTEDADNFEVRVEVDYTFTAPDGCEVRGQATCRRLGGGASPLPSRNTPLALLYISPQHYALL